MAKVGKLSLQMIAFCDEILKQRGKKRGERLTDGQCYMKVYRSCKREDAAVAAASRLLGTVKIQEYLETKVSKVSKKAEVTTERLLKEERRLAFADIRQIFDPTQYCLIPICDLPEDLARALAGCEVVERIVSTNLVGSEGDQAIETVKERKWKYRFWDKGKALERLEKYLGMFAKDNEQKRPEAELVVELLNKVAGKTRGLPNTSQRKIRE